MNIETAEEIYAALDGCDKKYNESNKRLTFKCVERAKMLNDPELEFDARFSHLQQLVFLSYDEEAVPLFPWFLKYCDEHEDFEKHFKTLWAYKWIIKSIDEFASIPKKRIQALADDFERRFEAEGATERLLIHYRMVVAANMGELPKSYTYLRQYEELSEECYLDDCEACMLNSLVYVLVINGKYQEAIDAAQPIRNKELTCSVVPKATYSYLLEASLMLGNWELSEQFLQAGLKAMNPREPDFDHYHVFLWVLAIQKKFIKGRNIVQAQLNLMGHNTSNHKRMYFYHACHLFCDALLKEGKKTLKIDLEAFRKTEPHFISPEEKYDVEALSQWFAAEWLKHARLLDSRNENSHYEEYLTKRKEEIGALQFV